MKNAKIKKILATSLVASMILVMLPNGARADWKQAEDNSWKYEDNSGVSTGWKLIDGTWYNFDENGVMKTGWINDNGSWYFLDESGAMKSGWINDKGTWYFTDASGAMKTGWIKDKDTWYFTDTTGAMKTGWVNDKGTWYFTDASGVMKTGWIKDKGTWYFSNISGAMQTGVIKIDEKIYSFAASGAMQVGKVILDGKEHIFANTGEALDDLPVVKKIFNYNGVETTVIGSSPSTEISDEEPSKNSSGGSGGSRGGGGSSGGGSNGGNNGGSNGGNNGGNNGGTQPQPQKKWNLVWSDEFNGDKLDTTKWDYQLGDGSLYGVAGWGNGEEQYYTKKNHKFDDGQLVIEARRDSVGSSNYTSTKIRTLGKFSKAFGKIEAAMTLPEGQGLWPAFWMLPEDEGKGEYGIWASCGEIDIMEARGRVTNMVDGTIHFGKPFPNNKSTGGHYTFPEGQDITGKHVYGVEWEPGEIRWYVDGNLYYTANNWYSQGQYEPEPYAYPAPFDKNFYIILNLAVGGWYDQGRVPDAYDMPAQMKVDYVRVYDLEGGYPVHPKPVSEDEELTEGRKPSADGNYILDPNLNQIQDNTGKDNSHDYWNFLTTAGGNANFATNGDDGLKVSITNGGTAPYSVQLIDHIPLRKNKHYKLTFEAKADDVRGITTQFGGGPERGWSKYSELNSSSLTTEWKEYEYSFDMASTSDPYARLEVNLGQAGSNVYIKNVRVEESDKGENNNIAKAPLETGEHIYNGTFNQGDDRKIYWDFAGDNSTFTVDKDRRAAEIAINNAGAKDSVILSQSGTNLLQNDKYKLTFKAHASSNRSIDVRFGSNKGDKPVYASSTFDLTASKNTYTFEFTMPQGVTDTEAVTAFLLGNAAGTVSIDDVSLIRLTNNNYDYSNVDLFPIKNGDFTLDGTYWETYFEGGAANITYPENLDKPAKIQVTNYGPNSWSVLWSSNKFNLTKKLPYILEFDAWSDGARDMIAKIENSSYSTFVEKTVQLNGSKQHVTLEFTMTADDAGQLKFLLGKTNNPSNTTVYIDNVMLRIKDAPVKAAPTVAAVTTTTETDYKGQKIVRTSDPIKFKYGGGEAGWDQSITGITINGEEVDPSNYVISNGTITFNEGTFSEAGTYDIVIKADGYLDVKLEQKLFSAKSANFALSKDVIASSVREGQKEYVADGNPSTRWSSNKTTAGQLSPEYIYVDLGKIYSVENVKTTWEGACATQYEIQTCISDPTNEDNWETVETVNRAGTAGTDNVFFEAASARYVRINCKIPALEWGYSIFELEVYGSGEGEEPVVDPVIPDETGTAPEEGNNPTEETGDPSEEGGNVPDEGNNSSEGDNTGEGSDEPTSEDPDINTNLALNKTVVASSAGSAFSTTNVNDGRSDTRWASDWESNNEGNPEFVYVDLENIYSIGNIKMKWEGAYAKTYEIQVCDSNPEDEASWETVKTIAKENAELSDDIALSNVSGRYVRIYCTEMGFAPYGYSLFELEVYRAEEASNAVNSEEVAGNTSEETGNTTEESNSSSEISG